MLVRTCDALLRINPKTIPAGARNPYARIEFIYDVDTLYWDVPTWNCQLEYHHHPDVNCDEKKRAMGERVYLLGVYLSFYLPTYLPTYLLCLVPVPTTYLPAAAAAAASSIGYLST